MSIHIPFTCERASTVATLMLLHNYCCSLLEGWSKNEQLQDILMNICYNILHYERGHTCKGTTSEAPQARHRKRGTTSEAPQARAYMREHTLLQSTPTPTPEFTPEFTPTPALLQLQLQSLLQSLLLLLVFLHYSTLFYTIVHYSRKYM